MVPAPERKPEQVNDRALLVWSPTKEIPDSKCESLLEMIKITKKHQTGFSFFDPVEEYITVAKEKYGYNGEQALGMLFWHKHDLERAVLDLANFTPFPDEWTVEDKVLFEQAFQFHGKSFHRIRQMVGLLLACLDFNPSICNPTPFFIVSFRTNRSPAWSSFTTRGRRRAAGPA